MAHFSERFYRYVPVGVQNIGVSVYGYYWYKRRFGGVFSNQLTQFKDRESYTEQQWLDYQALELRRLLQHAFLHVPFYRDKFSRSGLCLDDLKILDISQMINLPFLEKEELRRCGTSSLISANKEPGQFFSSSGSTGTPTQILFSHSMHQRWSAGFEARIRHWAGVDRFTPRGMIGGRRVVPDGNSRPPFYRYNLFEKQVYFSAYHISANNAGDYLHGMTRHGVNYMTGYAMSNFFLARFFEELKLEAPQLKAVITSSEKLTAEMRRTFQRVYNCRTYDSWSGVEACGLVSECEHGSLHISPDMGIIEILDEQDEPVKPGEVGEVVCTGLLNFDQPLIRYRIGDMMRLGTERCKCGRAMPVIDEILGRVEDIVIGRDGREMVRFHGIFVDLPTVKEAQIVQEDYDNFIVNISTDGLASRDAEVIIKRMKSQLGDIQVTLNTCSQIPRTANGKFRSVISKLRRH